MTKAKSFSESTNKLKKYDQATRNLMLTAMNFEDVYNVNFSLAEMVYLLRNSFKERLTHRVVLDENQMRQNTDPSSGFCMISSYLIYSLTGGDKVWELHGTPLHWWLYHKQSRTIFDITHTQFLSKDIQEIYKQGQPVNKLKTDAMFYDILKTKAHILAHRAGIE